MLHVLRHYLPLRKALLIASETVVLTMVVMAGMSAHLWAPRNETMRILAMEDALDVVQARWRCLVSALLVSVLAQVAIAFNELYDFRISSSRYDRASRFLGSAGSAIALLLALVGLSAAWGWKGVLDFPGLHFTQAVVLLTTTLIVGFVVLYLWRVLFHMLLRRSSSNERILILGSGRLAKRLVDELLSRTDSGFEIVGMLAGVSGPERRRRDRRRTPDDPPSQSGNPWFEAAGRPLGHGGTARALEPPRAALTNGGQPQQAAANGRLLTRSQLEQASATPEGWKAARSVEVAESIHELATHLRIDDVIVAFEERRGSLPTEELLRCRLDGIVVHEAEAFFERLTGMIPAEAMRPSYLIFNSGFVQHPLAEAAKRLVDFTLALAGLLLVWPVMLVTALLVRLDSPGPILFRQERTGRHGRPFTLLKFRSMRDDAEKLSGPVWAQTNDPRITRMGGFLRRTRLDEVPQLLNVLAGSMSLVGPRPERPPFVEELSDKIPYYHQRHIVKPGITGWAQLHYIYSDSIEGGITKLQYDLYYVRHYSLLLDLFIVIQTARVILWPSGVR